MLSELDQPTFDGLNDEQLDALQTVFNAANHVLWVTEDAWVENPLQAMIIGLLRTLRLEYPEIHVQVLDVDKAENLKPDFLVETILRLEDGVDWQESGILWTQEPEVYLRGGKVVIPRLKPDIDKNKRLNSIQRPILADLDPRQETLNFAYDGKKPFFKFHEERFLPLPVDESSVKIQVHYSLAKAIKVNQLGYVHLIQGKIVGSDVTVVALSETNASSIQVPSNRLVTVSAGRELATSVLPSISVKLIAETMLSNLAPGASLLVFECPTFYVTALSLRAAALGITVNFVSTKAPPKLQGIRWIQLHEMERQRSLDQKIPLNTSVFYDLSTGQSPTSLSHRLARCLAPSCSIRCIDHLFETATIPMSTECSQKAFQVLIEAVGGGEGLRKRL